MGNKKDFSISGSELKKYKGSGGHVEIPEGILKIGNSAFQGCETVTSVVIPEGVEIIGNDAFNGCRNLESVVIPDSVKWIFMRAFCGCDKLCDGDGFFVDRGVLLYYGGAGGDVVIPQGVTAIGDTSFEKCQTLTGVTIPESVRRIGGCAFCRCRNLTKVDMAEGVQRIESWAFADCEKLEQIVIPNSITEIDREAFVIVEALSKRPYLKKVTLPVSQASMASRLSSYRDDFRIDIADLSALTPTLRPCAALCFAEDGGLRTDIRFESHAKYLKTNAGKYLDQAAGNTAILALFCREGWIKAKDIQKLVDAVQQTGDPERIAMVLDYQANQLTSKQKDKADKQKEKQENTVLDRAVARINQNGIAGLNFVVTGELYTYVNRKALKTFIEGHGAKLQSSLSAKTDYLICNDEVSLFSWEAQNPNSEKKQKAQELGIEILTEFQFNEKAGRRYLHSEGGKRLKSLVINGVVTITDEIATIGHWSFRDCQNITNVTIGNSVTRIKDWTFRGCENLSSVTIPESVTAISSKAFEGCSNFTIHGKAGSCAETYAKENNIPFVAE